LKNKNEEHMTIHINDGVSAPVLEDEVLAGCAIHKVLNAVCTEPDCPNGPGAALTPVLWSETSKEGRAPIYRTETKMRCIL
jgi:hypothetical protein